jgi:protein-S-isoprenylcysteine O-methyltransferase Ste14
MSAKAPSPMDTAAHAPVGEALHATARGVLIVAVLLLAPAGLAPGGTWLWARGLAFIAAFAVIGGAGNVALAIWRPGHFRVRQQGVVASREKRQPLIDAIGAAGLLGFGAAWLIFIPIDVFRLHLLPAPSPWVSSVGALTAALGMALTPLAVWENLFATPNVQDQSGQGQRIVATGVYGLVRHPIYLGNLLLTGGGALWLGSYAAALIGAGVLLIATIGRIAIEERQLRAQFPEYEAYARRVRARLIPFVI